MVKKKSERKEEKSGGGLMGTIWSRESHPSHRQLGYEVSRSYTQSREIKVQFRLQQYKFH